MSKKPKDDDFNKVKMTDEQKLLFFGLTALQQKMAINTIRGMKPSDAHRAAGGKCGNEDRRTNLAGEILLNPAVKSFLNSMKIDKVCDAIMSRQEMMERLSNLARTPLNDLIEWSSESFTGDDGETLTQSQWRLRNSAFIDDNKMETIAELAATKDGFKIKQHSHLAAMKQLAELAGYNKPQELSLNQETDSPLSIILSGGSKR